MPSSVELRINQGLQLEVLRVDRQILALRPRGDRTGTPLGPRWDPWLTVAFTALGTVTTDV